MRRRMLALALSALTAAPALADGDAEAGAKVFNQCQACHRVVNAAGEVLAGKAGRTGPNLYALAGRTAGSEAEFTGYGDSLVALGATGFTWNEADFAAYVQDPGGFLKEKLGDPAAKARMSFRLRKAEDAADLWAYLASFAPAPAAGGAAPAN